ncbi:MAG: molybdopterin-dependent oxidoreductase [Clostridiales bacterium]|nr:molybdopterin-dependent oxidoreductase [Clostridiales bacterium]
MAEQVFTNLNTGGPISVYVEDGKITRIRPIQIPEEDYPKPWVIEDRNGKKYSPPKAIRLSPTAFAERNRHYSEDRILYPMKRVDFDPNGERNPQNRGKSGYERISWEEASSIVAGEIKRVTDTYGSHAITGITSSHHNWGIVGYKMGPFNRFMGMLNYTPILDNPDSWEGWMWGAPHIYGMYWRLGQPEQFDLLQDAFKHTDMVVFWSNDPDTTRGIYAGQESHIWRIWMKEMGMKCVFVDPFYNYTNATMDGTWFGLRPGSDVALAMGIAYTWITEGTYDKEYIADKTIGFDEFVSYVMGEEDGQPKTTEWAESETGIPARRIRALAREWASCKTSLAGGVRGGEGSACRTAYGTEHARMIVVLQAMQGLGKPGISIWGTTMGAPSDYTWFPGYAEPEARMGNSSVAKRKLAEEITVKQRLYRLTLPEAVMEGKDFFYGDGFCGKSIEQQFNTHSYPIEGPVKLFYRYGGSFIGTMSDTNKWVRMYQSSGLECVINQDCWFGGETNYADIILPACTNLERNDLGEFCVSGGYSTHTQIGCNWRLFVRQQKCVEPLGDSKSDYEIFSMIAEKLGMGELFTEGKSEDDWAKAFYNLSEISKRCSWDEFCKKGYYIAPVPEDYKETPAYRWYAENRGCDTPDYLNPKIGTDKAHELGTYSGKIEFASESLKALMPDDKERPPVPHFIPSWEGFKSEPYSRYPLQIISPHPRYSFHTHYDKHASWLDEIPMHRVQKDGYAWWPARINPFDAAERNIKGGDIIELYNDRASVLCIAEVTNRVPKGVMHSYGCSAKYDPLTPVPGATDKGGCINLLTSSRMLSKYAPGMTPNSCLVEARKWEG